jgi:hypothetical protein
MLPWRLTPEVKAAIVRQDCLGFDYPWQAASAILTHDDWVYRWDWSEATCEELETLEAWKNEILSRLN